MKATPEMIDAGAEAARKYMEETGGNSPAVIWDAMWAAQPFLPAQEPVDIASIIACREMLDAQPVPARVQYMGEDDDDDDTQVYQSQLLKKYTTHVPQYEMGWNAALDEAASRIAEIKGFEQATQDSFAVFIKGLKK